MKTLTQLIQESQQTADQAHQMGLKSAGWGKWKDKTGKVTHKTAGNKLVSIGGKEKAAGSVSKQSPVKEPIKPEPKLATPTDAEAEWRRDNIKGRQKPRISNVKTDPPALKSQSLELAKIMSKDLMQWDPNGEHEDAEHPTWGAFYRYSNGSDYVNQPLRSDKMDAHSKQMVDNLDRGFKIAPPLKSSITLHRGVDGNTWAKLQKANAWHDKGYTGTSSNPNVANVWARGGELPGNQGTINIDNPGGVLEIIVPEGSKVISTKALGLADWDAESETLLPRDSTFKIIKKSKDKIVAQLVFK